MTTPVYLTDCEALENRSEAAILLNHTQLNLWVVRHVEVEFISADYVSKQALTLCII